MKSIKTFFRTLFLSITSPAYYADVVKSRLSFSMKYFLFLNLLFSLIIVGKFLIPISLFDLQGATDQVVANYPADLKVMVNEGKISINKPLPYTIPMPQFIADVELKSERSRETRMRGTTTPPMTLQNLVVFDSDKNVKNPRDFYKYNSVALVTETTVYTLKDSTSSQIVAYPVSAEAKSFTISSNEINQLKQKFLNMPVIKNKLYVPLIGLAVLLVLYPAFVLWSLLVAFIYSIVMYFIARILQKSVFHDYSFSLSKVFQVSLHSMTLVVLAKMLTEVLSRPDLLRGWTYLFAYLLWTGITLWKASELLAVKRSTPVVSKPAAPKAKVKSLKKK